MIYKYFRKHYQGKEKEPTRAAVIRYDKENGKSPIVVAQGRGEVAKKIIEKAKEHNVAMQEDSILLENLLSLDLGSNVPPQLYQVVADILLFVRHANVDFSVSSQDSSVVSNKLSENVPQEEQTEEVDNISLDKLLQTIRDI
jgi:flagellar biosynthesis protein